VSKIISAVPMGATDCALPMIHAREQRLPVDVFVIYTDNETWFGATHPYKALQQYRETTGIPAKLVVAGLTATQFSIADPNDAGSLDVVGFDAAAPAVLADFARA
jgi:60 kDa SS-A/Ro ribonucleoprotein